MFCKECGKELNTEEKACAHCGFICEEVEEPVLDTAKPRAVFVLLGIFLGAAGIHNFYAGYLGKALAQLVLGVSGMYTNWITTIFAFLWAIADVLLVRQDDWGVPFK
ncbi:MAG: TM2 domain-containing protein [Candidatus Firestonebacteria bacterium]